VCHRRLSVWPVYCSTSLLPYWDFKWIQIANWREFSKRGCNPRWNSLIRKHEESAGGRASTVWESCKTTCSATSYPIVPAGQGGSRSSAGLMPQCGHRCRRRPLKYRGIRCGKQDPRRCLLYGCLPSWEMKSGTVISTRMVSSCHALSSSLAEMRENK
jgi:hypothetical protein